VTHVVLPVQAALLPQAQVLLTHVLPWLQHAPLHGWVPFVQAVATQEPFWHVTALDPGTSAVVHDVPQVPQLLMSVCRFVHTFALLTLHVL
jgi:hypothetical protein